MAKKVRNDSELIADLKNQFKDELMSSDMIDSEVNEVDILKAVPVSDKTKKELNEITPAVQQFLLRFMDVKEAAIVKAAVKVITKKNITDTKKVVHDLGEIMVQNQRILEHAARTEIVVKKIEEDHEKRLLKLERYTSFWQAVKRRFITVVISMMLLISMMYIFKDFFYWLIHRGKIFPF